MRFAFEGTVITDETDSRTVGSDLAVCLDTETCDWLTQPAVEWLKQTGSSGNRPPAMPPVAFWG
ncbi:MAG: hypothetical protein EBS83_10805 [Planctomycetia bacterium]|nr:hypothetical protein [Planctomycetia bacterium]